ncbi:MAG: alpha/beta hydrolase [Myxococcota bacterium]
MLALVGAGLVFGVWRGVIERLIFQPTAGADVRPEQLGIDAEDVFLQAEDGVRLHAYYLPSPGATRGLLFLHGNAGNASHRLPNAAELSRLGVHVLLLDYRGYGRSEGTPSEVGVYADARAALAHLVEVRRIPESRIVLFGRSLGGAVAVDLAQGLPLAGLILESTFTSVADVARHLLGVPVGFLLRGRMDSDRKIGNIRSPILFFHGDRDTVIDHSLGERLYRLAPGPKEFETIQGAGHNDTVSVGGRAYLSRFAGFLDRVVPEPPLTSP